MIMNNMIIATNWEEVEKGDFLLSDDWIDEYNKKEVKIARKLQRKNNLYYAYLVDAKDYCLYKMIDAQEILIDEDQNIILEGEHQPVSTEFSDKFSAE